MDFVGALLFQEDVGPNDLLRNQADGKDYWVSTVNVKGANPWQTAVFDRNRVAWLVRPIFLVNETESPIAAFVNHLVAMDLVAFSPSKYWPDGMLWGRPSAWAVPFDRLMGPLVASNATIGEMGQLYESFISKHGSRHF
jgi:hypothetical protein